MWVSRVKLDICQNCSWVLSLADITRNLRSGWCVGHKRRTETLTRLALLDNTRQSRKWRKKLRKTVGKRERGEREKELKRWSWYLQLAQVGGSSLDEITFKRDCKSNSQSSICLRLWLPYKVSEQMIFHARNTYFIFYQTFDTYCHVLNYHHCWYLHGIAQ